MRFGAGSLGTHRSLESLGPFGLGLGTILGLFPKFVAWSQTRPEDFRNAVKLSCRFGGRSGPYMRFGAGRLEGLEGFEGF